ncbi:hypothetical protein [Leisingera methylohalidivorans]|uniref:Uncharacterized protein n=1 Tax=Leisingera methylohalidivorans DSM 14336 TaxID=999552 RepID=V9VRU1_9RHOB|nr:hypothetical protein [Leisingera methylohalidivorans]AHD00050.1 hypothetical protein METH_04395 [Leisingera methylohalidivorans DSM 14336]
MSHSAPQFPLQSILKLDAAACAAMGGLLVLGSGPVAQLTQISAAFLFWAGLLLIPAAGFMAACARADRVPAWAAIAVVAGNALWVLASLAMPLAGLIAPNGLGWALLLVQAAAVALLTGLECRAAQHHPAAA